MSKDASAKERHILKTLRTVLGNIVKDAAPRPGLPPPLREDTVASIRELFALIAEREAELAKEAGIDVTERPYCVDDPQGVAPVTVHGPGKAKKTLN